MRRNRIPDVVIRRLPLYLRALEDFDARDKAIVSSQELGDAAGLTPAQVRKDLTFFGEFGKQGIGYDVKFLKSQLREILRLNHEIGIALVGAGHLGQAIIRFNADQHSKTMSGKRPLGGGDRLRIVAAFDVDPDKVGDTIAGVPVFHISQLEEKIKELRISIAIITVPGDVAQEVVDVCVAAGVKAILNFAPVKLVVPEDVRLHNADLSLELQSLAYYTSP